MPRSRAKRVWIRNRINSFVFKFVATKRVGRGKKGRKGGRSGEKKRRSKRVSSAIIELSAGRGVSQLSQSVHFTRSCCARSSKRLLVNQARKWSISGLWCYVQFQGAWTAYVYVYILYTMTILSASVRQLHPVSFVFPLTMRGRPKLRKVEVNMYLCCAPQFPY